MSFRRDLTGLSFGRLTVMSFAGMRKHRGAWLCRCGCGVERVVTASQLVTGKTKSCGCLHSESARKNMEAANRANRLPSGEAAKRRLVRSYKDGARSRNLAWDLTDEDCAEIFRSPCHYCGVGPKQMAETYYDNRPFAHNGIDRVDNSLGYVGSNVVPCCKICNRAKRELGYVEFTSWADRLAKHRQPEGCHDS